MGPPLRADSPRPLRRTPLADSAGRPAHTMSRRVWKLSEPWTHRTRPPLLGKRTHRVFHKLPHASSSTMLSETVTQVAGQNCHRGRRLLNLSLVSHPESLIPNLQSRSANA